MQEGDSAAVVEPIAMNAFGSVTKIFGFGSWITGSATVLLLLTVTLA